MLDKKVKDRWIEALRSGRYKQGRNYLKRGQYYCCLGVLCEVGTGSVKGSPWNMFNEALTTDVLSDDTQRILVKMNDSGYSFKDIASYIKKNL